MMCDNGGASGSGIVLAGTPRTQEDARPCLASPCPICADRLEEARELLADQERDHD